MNQHNLSPVTHYDPPDTLKCRAVGLGHARTHLAILYAAAGDFLYLGIVLYVHLAPPAPNILGNSLHCLQGQLLCLQELYMRCERV